jgi:hypothetical protein
VRIPDGPEGVHSTSPSAIAAVAYAWPRIDRQGDLLHLVEAEGVDGLELAALHDVRWHAPTELVAVDEQLGLRPPAVEMSVLAPGAQALPIEGAFAMGFRDDKRIELVESEAGHHVLQ